MSLNKKKKNNHRPLAQAGTSTDNKTGSWRTHRPEIDPNLCIGCSRCAKLCPDACILMKLDSNNQLKAEVDYDYCKGCGICAAECPVKAILMKKDY